MPDRVRWSRPGTGCSRCGVALRGRGVAPYWSPTDRLCPTCCEELAWLYDQEGWPSTSD